MVRKVNVDDRYVPTIGVPDWDIGCLDRAARNELVSRLRVSIIHTEDEFRTVMGYMHMKYPDLMDVFLDDGKHFQWCYHAFGDKIPVFDKISGKRFDMYALVYYDAERDMEPIAVGGSYFRKMGAIRDPWTHEVIPGQDVNPHTTTIRVGRGYRLWIDPDYRRCGLAQDQWLTEAQLYRDCDVHYQYEIQTYAALKVTQSIFNDPNRCRILEKSHTFKDGDSIRCVMDYRDVSLIKNFKRMPTNLKDFRNEPSWRFIEREGITTDELLLPWKNVLPVRSGRNGDTVNIRITREDMRILKQIQANTGVNPSDTLHSMISSYINM